MSALFTHTPIETAKSGDIVTNGIYEIRLIEAPRFTEDGRWLAKGLRWLSEGARWQNSIKTFGGMTAGGPL